MESKRKKTHPKSLNKSQSANSIRNKKSASPALRESNKANN